MAAVAKRKIMLDNQKEPGNDSMGPGVADCGKFIAVMADQVESLVHDSASGDMADIFPVDEPTRR